MSDLKSTFRKESEIAFNEEHWQKINYNTSCYERNFTKGIINYQDINLEKQRAYTIRNKSLLKLEKLLVDFETHFTDNGGKVLWARDAQDARNQIFDIINRQANKTVIRSNSMVLDEIELNGFLQKKGIPLSETSVARYVLKIADMKPYHPIAPAIHLSKEEINDILTKNFKLKPDSSVKQMVNFVRYKVANEIKAASVCVTGANFLLSDVGGVVLTENEGNILKASSSAKVHIVVAGIAKVIPSIDDLGVLLPLLSTHATGQSMAAYNSITFGPSKNSDGPEQMYVILLNNNRTELLSQEKQRQVLSCIHCGACISVCPVYKNIGGYTFGTTHIGPFGLICNPLVNNLKDYEHFTSACSLCGRCTEVCPVKIPLDDLMVENRHLVNNERVGDAKIEALLKALIWHCKSRKKMDAPLWVKRLEMKKLYAPVLGTRRTMPELATKSFSQMWREMSGEE